MPSETLVMPTKSDTLVTEAEARSFREEGYVVPERGLDSAATAALCAACEQIFRDNPDWHNLLRMPYVPLRPGRSEGVIGGEKIFEIGINPDLLRAVRMLIGDDLIMWGSEIFAKPAAIGKHTPWHQDGYTPAIKAGPGRARPGVVMLWIAIDHVDVDNGCLRFIPGSGRDGLIQHNLGRKQNVLLDFEVEEGGLRFDDAVNAIRPPGYFSAHDQYVVHGSNANTSGRRRAGLSLHYMNAVDAYDRSFGSATGTGAEGKPAPLAERPIWLVLGENRNPLNDFTTGHDNLADLDAMAEARRVEMNARLN